MIYTYTHTCKCNRCGEWFPFLVSDPVPPVSTTGFACPPCSVILLDIAAKQQEAAYKQSQQMMFNASMFGGPWRPGGIIPSVVDPLQDQLSRLETRLEDYRQGGVLNLRAEAKRLDREIRDLDAMIDQDRERLAKLEKK